MTNEAAAPTSERQGPTIAALLFQGDTFFQNIQKGMQQAARKNGVNLIVNNTNNDPSREVKLMNDLISRQVDAILISPLSVTGSVATIRQAVQADIPVICYNTCLNAADTKRYVKAFLQTNQTTLGRETGEYARGYIQRRLGGRATIGILNCDRFEACKQRKAGFKRALRGLRVTFAADQEGFLADKATGVAENVLTGNPNINVLWSANEGGTVGEVTAVKSQGRAGEVVVFGTDISPQLARFLLAKDNILQATTGQSPLLMGSQAVTNALKAIKGQRIAKLVQITPNDFFSRAAPAKTRQYLSKR
jgi:simple sugar transport system substrate-binding protein